VPAVKSDTPYLGHIADSIAAIESYVAGGRNAFFSERIVQDAVIRNFEVIGEAANRLSPALKSASHAPWSKNSIPQSPNPRLLEHRPPVGLGRHRKRFARAEVSRRRVDRRDE
jgi:hypothetical protein